MVVQLRDRYDDLSARDVATAVVTLGTTADAHRFRRAYDLPFLLLADPHKRSYRAAGLHRARLAGIAGPTVWTDGARAILRRGIAIPKQDVRQLGGAMVVRPGGRVVYLHRSTTSKDNVSIDGLLGAVSRR